MGYQKAKQFIQQTIPNDPLLSSALIFNLDPKDGSWLCNMNAIFENQSSLYGFEKQGDYEGSTLILNGANSFQKELNEDINLYKNGGLPKISQNDIIKVENAGHGLHFEQPRIVRKLIH